MAGPVLPPTRVAAVASPAICATLAVLLLIVAMTARCARAAEPLWFPRETATPEMALTIAEAFTNRLLRPGEQPQFPPEAPGPASLISRWTRPVRLAIVGLEAFDEPGIEAATALRTHLAYLRDIAGLDIRLVDAQTGQPNFIIAVYRGYENKDEKGAFYAWQKRIAGMLALRPARGEKPDAAWIGRHYGEKLSPITLIDYDNAIVAVCQVISVKTDEAYLTEQNTDVLDREKRHMFFYDMMAKVDEVILRGLGCTCDFHGKVWISLPATVRQQIFTAHPSGDPAKIALQAAEHGFFYSGKSGSYGVKPGDEWPVFNGGYYALPVSMEATEIFYASHVPNGVSAEAAVPYILETLRHRPSIDHDGK
jgi:hypothetical protein